MRMVTTIEELSDMIRHDDFGKWDEEVKVSRIRQNDFGEFLVDGRRMNLTSHAEAQLYGRLGIPAHYARRCPAELLAPHVNHWLEERSDQTWLLRMRGDEVRAILSTSYSILDNRHILNALLENIEGQGFQITMSSVGDDIGFHVRLVLPDVKVDTGALRSGERDNIFGGIHVSNSEIGKRSATVELMLWRLVCTNGMVGLTSGDRFRQAHRGAGLLESFEEKVSRVLRSARSDLEYSLFEFEQTMGEVTEYGEEIVKAYSEKNHLDKATTEEAVAQLHYQSRTSSMHVFSKYDIINAFTAAARTKAGDERYKVEAVAGKILGDSLSGMERIAMRYMEGKNHERNSN